MGHRRRPDSAAVANVQLSNKGRKCQTRPLLGTLEKVTHHQPTSYVCSHTHSKEGGKRGLHCVSELFRFHLEKTTQAENFVF